MKNKHLKDKYDISTYEDIFDHQDNLVKYDPTHLKEAILFLGKSVKDSHNKITDLDAKYETKIKLIDKNTERYLSIETELDQIQNSIKELISRTDMNLKGRMIDELEQIPNVIDNITMIPVVSQKITLINDRLNAIDKKLIEYDKRINNTYQSYQTLDLNVKLQSDLFEDIRKSTESIIDRTTYIEEKFSKYLSRDQFDVFRKDQYSKFLELQKDLDTKSSSNKNIRNSNSKGQIDDNIYLKEETFYNEKVELESKIATMYNSFEDFKESLSEVYIKNVIKEQFVKVAVLNSDFKQYKSYVKEKHDKFERIYEDIIGKIDKVKEIVDTVKNKQSKIVDSDQIDILKGKVNLIYEKFKESNRKVNKKASIRYSVNYTGNSEDKNNSKQDPISSTTNKIQRRHASMKIDGVANLNDLNEVKNQMELDYNTKIRKRSSMIVDSNKNSNHLLNNFSNISTDRILRTYNVNSRLQSAKNTDEDMLIEKSGYDSVMDEIEIDIEYHEQNQLKQSIEVTSKEKGNQDQDQKSSNLKLNSVKKRKFSKPINDPTQNEDSHISENSDYEVDEELENRLNEMDSKFQKGINTHAYQIDAIQSDLAKITKRIDYMEEWHIESLNKQIAVLKIDSSMLRDEIIKQLNNNIKITRNDMIYQIDKNKTELFKIIADYDNRIEIINKESKEFINNEFSKNLESKFDNIKIDQDKVKEEIKEFISQDVIQKMQTQIKQLTKKLKNDDPLISKTKLDKCASCYQSLYHNRKYSREDDKYTNSPRHNMSPNKTKYQSMTNSNVGNHEMKPMYNHKVVDSNLDYSKVNYDDFTSNELSQLDPSNSFDHHKSILPGLKNESNTMTNKYMNKFKGDIKYLDTTLIEKLNKYKDSAKQRQYYSVDVKKRQEHMIHKYGDSGKLKDDFKFNEPARYRRRI